MVEVLSNEKAEQRVLRTCMTASEIIYDITDYLTEYDFGVDAHRSIYRHIITLLMDGSIIDTITVGNMLTRMDDFELFTEISKVEPLLHHELKSYIDIIKGLSKKRAVINAGSLLIEEGSTGNPDELIDKAEDIIYKAAYGIVGDTFKTPNDIIDGVVQDIHTKKEAGGNIVLGLRSGIDALDYKIYGFERTDLVIIAGRPGMGKTELALQYLLYNILQEIPMAIFSLEMSRIQLMERLIAAHLQIPLHKIKSGLLNTTELKLINSHIDTLKRAPLYIEDDPTLGILDIVSRSRKLKIKERGLGGIVVDYMQLMVDDPSKANVEVTRISRNLKILAKQLDIPVVALSQLSRALETRSDKRPTLSDLRESGSIEQDSDKVIFLYDDSFYTKNEEDKYKTELIVAKHRNGPTGVLNVTNNKDVQTFFDEVKLKPTIQAVSTYNATIHEPSKRSHNQVEDKDKIPF